MAQHSTNLPVHPCPAGQCPGVPSWEIPCQRLTCLCTAALQGNALVCPVGTISVIRKPTDGRLNGMQCYSTATSMEISNATPMKNVSELLVVTEAGELGLRSTPGVGVLTVCLTVRTLVRVA